MLLQVFFIPLFSFTYPGNRQLTVFNDQSLVQIGGLYNPSSQTVERPFVGVIAAALYNGLRPLDLAASKKQAKIHGDVHVLKSGIPFDYKDTHPHLFTEEAMKTMMDSVFTTGGSYDVSDAGRETAKNRPNGIHERHRIMTSYLCFRSSCS